MSSDQLLVSTKFQKFEDLRNEVNRLKALLEVNIEVANRLDRLVKAVKLDQSKYLGDVELCLEIAKGTSTKERSTANLTAPTYHDLVENIVLKSMTLAAEQQLDNAAESTAFLRLLQTELDELLNQISPDRAAFRSQLGLLRIVHQFHVAQVPAGVRAFSEIPVGDLRAAKAYLDAHHLEALTSEAQAALVSQAYEAELLGDLDGMARAAQAVSVAAPYAEDKMERLLLSASLSANSESKEAGDARKQYQIEYDFFVEHVKSRCAVLKQEASVGIVSSSTSAAVPNDLT